MEFVPEQDPGDPDWPVYVPQPMKVGCYECGGFDGHTAPERLVIGEDIASPQFDPTTAYKLICGHWAI